MRFILPAAAAAATIAIAALAQTTHQPPAGGAAAPAMSPAQTFTENCAACHQEDGKGIPGAFPALAGSKLAIGPASAPILVVLNGRAGMPTFKADLTDAQIAAALTYVRMSWGNAVTPITEAQVAALRTGDAPVAANKRPIQAH